MKKIVIYVHGKGGNISEAEHYKKLFKGCEVVGFDYKAQNPWEAKQEFALYFDEKAHSFEEVIIIANSIGAYFAMQSLSEHKIDKAFFISPIVDMKKLIEDMIVRANVSLEELKKQKRIETAFNETLDYDYYCYVKDHPLKWNHKTFILYGDKDNLTSIDTITEFVKETDSHLTVMKDGEHWFHSDEQLKFLDEWIKNSL